MTSFLIFQAPGKRKAGPSKMEDPALKIQPASGFRRLSCLFCSVLLPERLAAIRREECPGNFRLAPSAPDHAGFSRAASIHSPHQPGSLRAAPERVTPSVSLRFFLRTSHVLIQLLRNNFVVPCSRTRIAHPQYKVNCSFIEYSYFDFLNKMFLKCIIILGTKVFTKSLFHFNEHVYNPIKLPDPLFSVLQIHLLAY